MVKESRHVLFRSFSLAFWTTEGQLASMVWQGPKVWEPAIRAGLQAWAKHDGYAGLTVVEYLDALGIGRNVPKSVKATPQI